MKSKYWMLLLAAAMALCLGLSIPLLMPGEAATHAEILSGGQVIHTVDLRVDREILVEADNGGENLVVVSGGKIGVAEATCPDHYCMHR